MKTLKRILIIAMIIIAIPLIIALFVSREFEAKSTVIIDKPNEEVFDYVRMVGNQENFGVWFAMDPEIKTTSKGVDGTEGFVFSWESDVVGNGTQTITRLVERDSIISLLDFGFGEPARGYFHLEELEDDKTEVTWGIQGTSPYPFNLMSLFMDFNKDFETGTRELKNILESQPRKVLKFEELRDFIKKTYVDLETAVDGLSDHQLNFKPAPDRWSVAQCVEHIVLTAPKLNEYLQTALDGPANPERKSEVKMKDEDIMAGITNREYKAQASEDLIPSQGMINVEQRLEELDHHYDLLLRSLDEFTMEDLRNRIMDAPFGAVDTYQFAIFIPGHTARHTLQIEEVKTDPGFPKN